ncbi:hypothetical protein [Romboutsia sp.]|uniref:hypothetical protein n=1 Tax=Romboutsia sp. TaxID=1965302 RepID=UPI003F36541D
MTNSIFEIYTKEINNIIKDNKVTEVFLVGSSKNKELTHNKLDINDIDIFVFRAYGEKQERIIKTVNKIDFDINYFSTNGVDSFIKNKEYFFLKEMKDPKIIYDKNNKAQNIIDLCKKKYIEGPKKLSSEEKEGLKLEIFSKIESLQYKVKYSQFEFTFLTNICLKDIIIVYFRVNNKWIPKDKKLLKTLENEDKYLFELIKRIDGYYQHEELLNVYKYIFKIKH